MAPGYTQHSAKSCIIHGTLNLPFKRTVREGTHPTGQCRLGRWQQRPGVTCFLAGAQPRPKRTSSGPPSHVCPVHTVSGLSDQGDTGWGVLGRLLRCTLGNVFLYLSSCPTLGAGLSFSFRPGGFHLGRLSTAVLVYLCLLLTPPFPWHPSSSGHPPSSPLAPLPQTYRVRKPYTVYRLQCINSIQVVYSYYHGTRYTVVYRSTAIPLACPQRCGSKLASDIPVLKCGLVGVVHED